MQMLREVRVVDLPYILGVIDRNKASENMMSLAISIASQSPELAKKLSRDLQRASTQVIGLLPSPTEGVSEAVKQEIEAARKRTRQNGR